MSAADSSLLRLWSALSIVGFVVVIVGVAMEGAEVFARLSASSANTSAGITYYLNTAPIRPPGQSYEWPYVLFVRYGTNPQTGKMQVSYLYENTSGFRRPITVNTNDVNEIFEDLGVVFQQIEIPFAYWEDAYWAKPGETILLVPSKND